MVRNFDIGQFLRICDVKLGVRSLKRCLWISISSEALCSTVGKPEETALQDKTGVVPVEAVEVLRSGRIVSPVPTLSTLSSRHAGWDGIAMESFNDVPACSVPEHEHPTHFLNLQRLGQVTFEWTTDGRTRRAKHGPGNLYILPAGTRDRLTRSGPTDQIVLVMAPQFLPERWTKQLTWPTLS